MFATKYGCVEGLVKHHNQSCEHCSTMKNKYVIRKLFQMLTIILFIIQFQQSIRKYFQYPVVEQTSRVPVKDLPIPVVYVCQTNQFNYENGKENGYTLFFSFMSGSLMNSTKLSWQGKEGNQTYKALESILLDHDYSMLNSTSLLSSSNLRIVNEWKRIFLFPHGFCMKLENMLQQTIIDITSTKNINIYFVDPAKANDIRTEETLDAKASIGPTTGNFFSLGNYELEYMLYDDSIHDGTTCTDYNKLEMSYGECLNDILTQESLDTYGCLLPWVSTNKLEIICKNQTNIDAETMQNTTLYTDIRYLIKNYETLMFKKCLPPCSTMKIKLEEVSYKSNILEFASFETKSKDWATVYTQVYSYDILSLTVDLGSALGLWMGLSCLSILDHILDNCISIKIC